MKPYYQKMKGGTSMKVPGMYEMPKKQAGGGGRFRNWVNKTFSKGVHIPGSGKAKVRKRKFTCKNGICR
jgi:hypothetical protein